MAVNPEMLPHSIPSKKRTDSACAVCMQIDLAQGERLFLTT